MMGLTSMIRIPAKLIEELREFHPELVAECDSVVARVALQSYLIIRRSKGGRK